VPEERKFVLCIRPILGHGAQQHRILSNGPHPHPLSGGEKDKPGQSLVTMGYLVLCRLVLSRLIRKTDIGILLAQL
jgi:hypothetical protein